ncbi:glycosyltransferase family 2 protein [uncultured Sunxiuqinia sp.]|uniref:glycosyltransferase family 2 protein n=1 Tax=uncultured Sunxiuqinia sp. TaxID=1573825 RepID=UPI002AA86DA0|nr:glycosyltransferase family 2 protein [uncultured Sunxiuqinia sp.]
MFRLKNNPPISVVLPFCQAEQTLARAIQSILDQSFKEFELLLVDNNSTYNSVEIARQFAHADSRIKLFSEPQQGVIFTMNRVMHEAKGKYIARMDADDISLPERLDKAIIINLLKNI